MEERLSLIDQIINNFYQNQCSTHKTDSEEERSPSQQKIIIKKANNRQFNQLKLFKNLRCFHHVYKLFNVVFDILRLSELIKILYKIKSFRSVFFERISTISRFRRLKSIKMQW